MISFFKGRLFVELLSLNGIEARLHWVQLKKAILNGNKVKKKKKIDTPIFVFSFLILSGIIDPPGDSVDHVYTEIKFVNRWVKTDSYIVDKSLFEAAQSKLLENGGSIAGFGIHSKGTCECLFPEDSFSQGFEDITTRDLGVEFKSVEDFFRSSGDFSVSKIGWITSFIFPFFAWSANRACDVLRKEQTHEKNL